MIDTKKKKKKKAQHNYRQEINSHNCTRNWSYRPVTPDRVKQFPAQSVQGRRIYLYILFYSAFSSSSYKLTKSIQSKNTYETKQHLIQINLFLRSNSSYFHSTLPYGQHRKKEAFLCGNQIARLSGFAVRTNPF